MYLNTVELSLARGERLVGFPFMTEFGPYGFYLLDGWAFHFSHCGNDRVVGDWWNFHLLEICLVPPLQPKSSDLTTSYSYHTCSSGAWWKYCLHIWVCVSEHYNRKSCCWVYSLIFFINGIRQVYFWNPLKLSRNSGNYNVWGWSKLRVHQGKWSIRLSKNCLPMQEARPEKVSAIFLQGRLGENTPLVGAEPVRLSSDIPCFLSPLHPIKQIKALRKLLLPSPVPRRTKSKGHSSVCLSLMLLLHVEAIGRRERQ